MSKRRLLVLSILLALGAGVSAELIACDSAELTTYPDCRGAGCSCEQDPSQARCRGFSPDEGGTFEGGTISEGGIETDADTDSGLSDSGFDASDADDASDAEDQ